MRRARWWIVGGVAAIVVIVAGLWLWSSTNRSSTPEDAALDYLHALESGDPDAVTAAGSMVTVTALEAFGAATALIEEGEVTDVRENARGDAAAVAISFVLEGEEHTAELTLGVADGRWGVDATGLGTLTPDSTIGSDVAIGDTIIPLGEATPLLPGTYIVAAAPTTLLDGESPVQVLPGADVTATVDAAVRPEATAAAQAQLDDLLEACTAPGAAVPDACGIRIPWGTEFRTVEEITYRIDDSPAVALTPSGFTASGGVLVATVTGIGQNGETRTTTYRTDSWDLRGGVEFTADGLTLSPW